MTDLKNLFETIQISLSQLNKKIKKLEPLLLNDCYSRKINLIVDEWKLLKKNIIDVIDINNKLFQILENSSNKKNPTDSIKDSPIFNEFNKKYYIIKDFEYNKNKFLYYLIDKKLKYTIIIDKYNNKKILTKILNKYFNLSNAVYFIINDEYINNKKEITNNLKKSKYYKNIGLINTNGKIIKKANINKTDIKNLEKIKNKVFEVIYNKYIEIY